MLHKTPVASSACEKSEAVVYEIEKSYVEQEIDTSMVCVETQRTERTSRKWVGEMDESSLPGSRQQLVTW